jgi:hypothetical protein
MSQQNVDLIRQSFEHLLETGDMDLSTLHPKVEWHDPPDFPDRKVHHGPGGAITAIGTWLALVYKLRQGKIVRARAFFDTGQALNAAGLRANEV